MAVDADLVILGGGGAGLSLARHLAIVDDAPRVGILEPRHDYVDDRSWCFWRPPQHDLAGLVSNSWERWRYSAADGRSVSHAVDGVTYQYIRGIDFYRDALDRIAGSSSIELRLGVRAGALEAVAGGVRIETDEGAILARHVVDTRPSTAPALLFQCFAGVEIEVDGSPFHDPGEVALMTQMTADADGLAFLYVLPLDGDRALVEWTRFSEAPLPRHDVETQLDEQLARLGLGASRVLRTEGGTLPMGTAPAASPAGPSPVTSGVVEAGIRGGALRAASGYGFLRMQAWAERCARALAATGAPVGHPVEPFARREMDRIFLQAVRAHPERTAEYFMDLATGVDPRRLLRFLTDRATPGDYAQIIASLPFTPFLAQIPRRAWHSPAIERVLR